MFFNDIRFLALLVKGILFHWLSVAASPLLPLMPLPALLHSPPTLVHVKVGVCCFKFFKFFFAFFCFSFYVL